MDGASESDPLDHMQQRAEMCRRLAKGINDRKATEALRQMADEIEVDIKALLAEREAAHRNGG